MGKAKCHGGSKGIDTVDAETRRRCLRFVGRKNFNKINFSALGVIGPSGHLHRPDRG